MPPSVSCMTRGKGLPLLKGGSFPREHQCENNTYNRRFPGPAKTQSKRKSGSRSGWRLSGLEVSRGRGGMGVERQDSTCRSGHTPSLFLLPQDSFAFSPETGTSTAHRLLPPNFMGEWPCQMGTEALPSPGTSRKVLAHGGGVLETQPPPACETLLSPSSPPPQRHSRDFSLLESHASSLPRAKMSSQWWQTVGQVLASKVLV